MLVLVGRVAHQHVQVITRIQRGKESLCLPLCLSFGEGFSLFRSLSFSLSMYRIALHYGPVVVLKVAPIAHARIVRCKTPIKPALFALPAHACDLFLQNVSCECVMRIKYVAHDQSSRVMFCMRFNHIAYMTHSHMLLFSAAALCT